MNLKIVKTIVISRPYIDPGKKDRRYKSGYRFPPAAASRIELMFIVANEDGFIRHSQTFQVERYGRYCVVAIDNTGEIKTATLKVTAFDDMIRTTTIEIPNQINALACGFTVGEGSSYTKPKFDNEKI